MRITAVAIDNFLSFHHFEWSPLDAHINVIVGPNGAGKSNLFHATRAAADALDPDRRTHWEAAIRSGEDAFRVALDIEMNERERELLRLFLCVALADSGPEYAQNDPDRWEDLVERLVDPDTINWLAQGRLVVTYERRGDWHVVYEALPERPAFQWNVIGSVSLGLTTESGGVNSFSAVLQSYLEAQEARDVDTTGHEGLRWPSESDGGLHRILASEAVRSNRLGITTEIRRAFHLDRVLPWARTLEDRVGIRFGANRIFDGRALLEWVVRGGLLTTSNVRVSPNEDFDTDALHEMAPEFSKNGSDLALSLFRLKNGDAAARGRYREVQRLFATLTGGLECDVGLSSHLSAPGRIALELSAARSGAFAAPLSFAGAGVAEALFLSTVIVASDDGRALLLDEPASNLHPAVQTHLLNSILSRERGQFFVVTHSPSMIKPDSLSRVVRFSSSAGDTRLARINTASLSDEQQDKLRKELRRNSDAAALLFASSVVLVEGETELGALPVWHHDLFQESLDASNTILYSVSGDPNFETYIRYLDSFGVPFAIVCDGPAIQRSPEVNTKDIATQLRDAGLPTIKRFESLDFKHRVAALKKRGVFTVADKPTDEFENLDVIKEHREDARQELGGGRVGKVRPARYIAENYPCPRKVADLLRNVRTWLKIDSTPGSRTEAATPE